MASNQQSPIVIEAAMSQVVANTDGFLLDTAEIIDEAGYCIAAGAGIIHYHHDFSQDKAACIQQCIDVQKGILARYPEALIYPGYLAGDSVDEIMGHLQPLHEAGAMAMFAFDPGYATHARPGPDGEPTQSKQGGTSFAEAHALTQRSWDYGVPCSLGIFEPGALNWVRYYGAQGRFTPGTVVKFYFPGDFAWGVKGTGTTFGVPISKEAIDIYVSQIEGSGLPWMVSMLGGAILETGLARYIVEKGGHLRVGLEDPLRPSSMTNAEMVEAVVAIADEVGRPIAHYTEAKAVLSAQRVMQAA